MNISIATIPPRFNSLLKSLRAFLNQTLEIKKIYVNLPEDFKRFENFTPEQEEEIKAISNKIVITKTPYDSPALKYLGCLPYVDKEDFIFVGDDDQEYHPELLEKMKEGIYNEGAVYQNRYHIVKHGTAGIIHGFVGLMLKAKLLSNIKTFDLPKTCWVDDQLFSIYFHKNNIPILPSPVNDFDEIYSKTSSYGTEQIGDGALCKMDLPRKKQIKELELMYNVFFLKKNHHLSKGKIKDVIYKNIQFPTIHLVILDKPTKENKKNMKMLIEKYPHFNYCFWDFKAFEKDHPEIELKTITQLNYWANKFGLEKIREDKGEAIYINRNLLIDKDFDLWEYLLNDENIFTNEKEILLIKKSYVYNI